MVNPKRCVSHVYLKTVLSFLFVGWTQAVFNPVCYVDRSGTEGSLDNKQVGSSLLDVNLTTPHDQVRITFAKFGLPRDNCALDVYLYGQFYVFELFLELTDITCVTETPGYSSPAKVIKIKSARQEVDLQYPDIPISWWEASGTVALVKIDQVNAEEVGVYHCVIAHSLNSNIALQANVTISVNGCPVGRWGDGCKYRCQCQNGGVCHSWDGSCLCPKVWKGKFCLDAQTIIPGIPIKIYMIINELDPPDDLFIENPHVEIEPSSRKLYVGDELTLTCLRYAINGSDGNFTWVFDGRETSKSISNDTSSYSVLKIGAVNDNDAGTYRCAVADAGGKVYTHIHSVRVSGCRPGLDLYGQWCTTYCQCKNATHCDRFQGCVCSQGFTGRHCEVRRCLGESCEIAPVPVGEILGGVVGGMILLIIVILLLWKRPWEKVEITYRSDIHEEYVRCKDLTALAPRGKLQTAELGVLWDHWTLSESNLYLGSRIDEGHFCSVYQGHIIQNRKFYDVAVKILKNDKDQIAWKNFLGEFQILAHVCPHPNIIQLVGLSTKSVVDDVVTCLVLERMANGSLYRILHDNRYPKTCSTPLAPQQYRRIVLDILCGMAHLEKMRYVHRDLASRNILLNDTLVAKISDFGLSRDTYSTGDYQLGYGRKKRLPWKWMAYECLKDNIYTSKSDVWSFGILLWEISTLGASPYPGIANEELLAYLEKGYRPKQSHACPKTWQAAMNACWLKDDYERPSFEELHDLFKRLRKGKHNLPSFTKYQDEINPEEISSQVPDESSENSDRLIKNSPGLQKELQNQGQLERELIKPRSEKEVDATSLTTGYDSGDSVTKRSNMEDGGQAGTLTTSDDGKEDTTEGYRNSKEIRDNICNDALQDFGDNATETESVKDQPESSDTTNNAAGHDSRDRVTRKGQKLTKTIQGTTQILNGSHIDSGLDCDEYVTQLSNNDAIVDGRSLRDLNETHSSTRETQDRAAFVAEQEYADYVTIVPEDGTSNRISRSDENDSGTDPDTTGSRQDRTDSRYIPCDDAIQGCEDYVTVATNDDTEKTYVQNHCRNSQLGY